MNICPSVRVSGTGTQVPSFNQTKQSRHPIRKTTAKKEGKKKKKLRRIICTFYHPLHTAMECCDPDPTHPDQKRRLSFIYR